MKPSKINHPSSPIGTSTPVLVTLALDTSEMDAQVKELGRLLSKCSPDGLPGNAEGFLTKGIDRLFADPANIVLREDVPTTLADGTLQLRYSVRLGRGFEKLAAALRAGDFHVLHGDP